MANLASKELKIRYFLEAYRSCIAYLQLGDEFYNIDITRDITDSKNVSVKVSIKQRSKSRNNESNSILKINIDGLSSLEANSFINSIREEFQYNHVITYASVDERGMIQKLQNTNFLLRISLLNDDELKHALEVNRNINMDSSRTKVRRLNPCYGK